MCLSQCLASKRQMEIVYFYVSLTGLLNIDFELVLQYGLQKSLTQTAFALIVTVYTFHRGKTQI